MINCQGCQGCQGFYPLAILPQYGSWLLTYGNPGNPGYFMTKSAVKLVKGSVKSDFECDLTRTRGTLEKSVRGGSHSKGRSP